MGQEILETIRGMNGRNIEMQIAFQCAPLIAGLKVSNLLMVPTEDMDRVRKILKRTGIFYFVAAETRGKTAVLLFDRSKLEAYLWEEKVWRFFSYMGYREHALGKVLYAFRQRYEGYLAGNQMFPHEMGLLLGYPMEDVEGYIRNDGKNCLYAGYWKVYGKLSEKMVLFHEFERARNQLIHLLSDGLGIVEIIQEHLIANKG